jgi:2-C-methyl-D-erythritol 2,4-cyclodiphosphate synthase
MHLPYRVGHGYDLHRLEQGGHLVLAGVTVSEEMHPIAHSDGDVVLHATVDALLGAIAAGDIGEHFPNTDPQWRAAPSSRFIARAMELVSAAGYRVANVDALIIAERPKLKAFKPAMKQNLAQMLRVQPDQVNIKAGTNEGCDSLGRGEAIAADVTILLVRSPEQ